MKATFLKAAVFVTAVTFASCSSSTTTKQEAPQPESKLKDGPVVPEGRLVPESTAIKDIQRFAEACSTSYGGFPNRAFTMNTTDLIQALQIPCAVTSPYNVRGYFALDRDNNFKMYLVRVVGANLDTVPQIPGTDSLYVLKGKKYVFDLNAPCPNTCDVTSPLYLAGQ